MSSRVLEEPGGVGVQQERGDEELLQGRHGALAPASGRSTAVGRKGPQRLQVGALCRDAGPDVADVRSQRDERQSPADELLRVLGARAHPAREPTRPLGRRHDRVGCLQDPGGGAGEVKGEAETQPEVDRADEQAVDTGVAAISSTFAKASAVSIMTSRRTSSFASAGLAYRLRVAPYDRMPAGG